MLKYDRENELIYNEETGEQFYDVYGDEISINQNDEIVGGLNMADLRPVDWDGIDYYTPQGRKDLTKIERFFGNDLTNTDGQGWHVERVKDSELTSDDVKRIRRNCMVEVVKAENDIELEQVKYQNNVDMIQNEVYYSGDRIAYCDKEYNIYLHNKREKEKELKKVLNKWIGIFSGVFPELVFVVKCFKNNEISFEDFLDFINPFGSFGSCYEYHEYKAG